MTVATMFRIPEHLRESTKSETSSVSISPTEVTLPEKFPLVGEYEDIDYLDDIEQVIASFEEYRKQAASEDLPADTRCEAAKILILKSDLATSNISDGRLKQMKQDTYMLEGLRVLKWLSEQSAFFPKKRGCAKAQLFLGKCYARGLLGMRQDERKAFKLFHQSAKQGTLPEACLQVGMCYEVGLGVGQNVPKSLKYYRKAADGGHVEAMYRLGSYLMNHRRAEVMDKEGEYYIRQAARANHVKALHELGLALVKGAFTEQEKIGAFKMFEKAAELGYAPAQFEIAQCFEYGWIGCDQCEQESLTWYLASATQGYGPAELALSRWYKGGHDTVLAANDAKAFDYAMKAADKGIPEAEYLVGVFYETGSGVQQNYTEAKRWYMRSASQSYHKAVSRLSQLKK
jgi:TPR repeat protein